MSCSVPSPEPAAPTPAACIDARNVACGRWLYGMNLVERQIRQLCLRGVQRICVRVSAESASPVRDLRSDLTRLYRFGLRCIGPAAADPAELYAGDAGDVIVLQGHVVYDDRVFDHVLAGSRGAGVCGPDGTFAVRLASDSAIPLLQQEGDLERGALERSGVRFTSVEELDPYVASLRLRMAPIMMRITADEDLRPMEQLMYRRTFKGVIDAVARYGYYHPVRWLTRLLCRTSLSPNLFTVLSILCIWGAVPLFALGLFPEAVGVAWTGVILDSVDGKLARLRLQLSDAMGSVEHVAAMPGLGLWYVATGYYLNGGALVSTQPGALLVWLLLAAFLLDKCVTGGFKALFGKELFDYAPMDAAFHLVAARRNTSLVLLTLGTATGAMRVAFWSVALWTGVALAFHGVRFLWIAAALRASARRADCGCRR